MTEGSTTKLPFQIGQRRNLAPVWIGASILVTAAAALIAAITGWGSAVPVVAVVIGVCAILFGFLQLRRPATLMLDKTGLTFIWLWRVHRWAWSNIDGFRVAHVRSGKAIMFDVYEGDGSSVGAVPALFEMDAQDIVAMLRRIRRTAIDGD